ncbi:MAG: alpha/beta fold hydrolase [Dermatophilaceae bacterium]
MPGAEPYSHDGNEVGVLFCHGYPSTPQSLRPWGEYLADQGYSVRLPLLSGHGTRWQDVNRTTWQDWYADLQRDYDELTARCDVIFTAGLSMGGLLATKVALENPQVRGLVLVNPIFKHNDPLLPLLPILHHIIPSLPGHIGDIKKEGVTELGYDRNPLHSMYSLSQLWKIVGEDLPKLTQPILLFRSREDKVVPKVSVEFFHEQATNCEVTEVWLENSYHVATLDNDAPQIFEGSVEFIEKLRN